MHQNYPLRVFLALESEDPTHSDLPLQVQLTITRETAERVQYASEAMRRLSASELVFVLAPCDIKVGDDLDDPDCAYYWEVSAPFTLTVEAENVFVSFRDDDLSITPIKSERYPIHEILKHFGIVPPAPTGDQPAGTESASGPSVEMLVLDSLRSALTVAGHAGWVAGVPKEVKRHAECWLVSTARKAGSHGVSADQESMMRIGYETGYAHASWSCVEILSQAVMADDEARALIRDAIRRISAPRARAVVYMEGGVITEVVSDRPVQLLTADADIDGIEESQLTEIDGEDFYLSIHDTEDSASVDSGRVDLLFGHFDAHEDRQAGATQASK